MRCWSTNFFSPSSRTKRSPTRSTSHHCSPSYGRRTRNSATYGLAEPTLYRSPGRLPRACPARSRSAPTSTTSFPPGRAAGGGARHPRGELQHHPLGPNRYRLSPGVDDVGGMRWGKLRGQDLNLRPSGYEPDELPGCSTPRRCAVLVATWGGAVKAQGVVLRPTSAPIQRRGDRLLSPRGADRRSPFRRSAASAGPPVPPRPAAASAPAASPPAPLPAAADPPVPPLPAGS